MLDVMASASRFRQFGSFAETARERFIQGGAEEKRAVLEGMSPNLTLKDKKLNISWPEPLLGFQISYKAMKQVLGNCSALSREAVRDGSRCGFDKRPFH